MLQVLTVTSKGITGVPRASLVVYAAMIPSFDLAATGLDLPVGIDACLDMGHAMANVIGKGVVIAVVAKWEINLGGPIDARARAS